MFLDCRAVTSVIFLIGSMYFVSGSYPHAQQFYYAVGRGHIEKDPAIFGDELGDIESGKKKKKSKKKATSKKTGPSGPKIYGKTI